MSSSLRSAESRTVLFFGDSLTAGYGLDNPTAEAYPALVQEKIASAHLDYRVVNAGLSGETSAGGARRIDWILRQPVDIFVLALGANDGLRGIDPAVTQANLQTILVRVRSKYPNAKLLVAGMEMPPAMGTEYTSRFRVIFPEVAKKIGATYIPFLLEGVGGLPDLNQGDRIHPNPRGHALVAETIWKTLRPLL
ncbi:MAG: arylesterase [Opitutaceae bacterium]